MGEICPDPGSRIQITTHTFPFQALFIKPAKADPKFENSLDPGSWILVLDFDMQDSFDEIFWVGGICPDPGSRIQVPIKQIQDPGFRIQSLQKLTPNLKTVWILDPGFKF